MIKKYLTAFDSEALYNAFKVSEEYITPNVSLIRTIKQLYFNKAVEPNVILINGVKYTDKVITLAAGGTYELQGVHEGQIIIDANSVKPKTWTTIIMNNATIISDDAYGILYNCPQSSNKGYQGLTVTLAKDSQNFVVCNKETTVEGDETHASIDSCKDLTVQGVGYLAVYNNIGHGLRSETLNVAGAHVYTDVEHDGIHGKTVNVFDGVFYFQKAKDAFGTTETGKLNIFGGSFNFINVTQDHFDSKNTTKLGIYNVPGELPTNMVALENIYDEGTVMAYPTEEDYKAKTNGVQLNPVVAEINSGKFYNADAEGNVVASSTPAGHIIWQLDDPIKTLFKAPLAYIVTKEYTTIEVTGKIVYPIVRPLDAVEIDIAHATFSRKGKLNSGYDNNFNVYLNGAVIVTNDDCPSIANLPDVGRVKVVAVKDTVNAVINKYNGEGTADHDAIKSENNLPIEVKNESILYVTSVLGDGVDGGETTFTDSKGAFIVSGCGERGVKDNAVVIGQSDKIDASVITSYITDPKNPECTTFDGIFVAKGNVTKEGNVVGNADTSSEEAAKASGYADVYGRNGKCSKGVFGTTNTELKGIAIIGSLTAHNNVDTGNAQNLHVNQILKAAANAVETVQEAYIAVPYEGDPIV